MRPIRSQYFYVAGVVTLSFLLVICGVVGIAYLRYRDGQRNVQDEAARDLANFAAFQAEDLLFWRGNLPAFAGLLYRNEGLTRVATAVFEDRESDRARTYPPI